MFVLSEESLTQATPTGRRWPRLKREPVRWRTISHSVPSRRALVVWSGHKWVSPELDIRDGDVLHLEFGAGLEKISSDGLDLIVRFVSSGSTEEIFREHVAPEAASGWSTAKILLSPFSGRTGVLEIECGPGPSKDPRADWLAITECIVGAPAELSLGRARMNRERRSQAEIAHFSRTYEMPAFQARARMGPFALAQTIMQKAVLEQPVQFLVRIRELAAKRPLRVASLCCGAASWERSMVRGIESRVNLTLVDINAELLERARAGFDGVDGVETLCADVNDLHLPERSFDVILCVSALHHVVELESLVDAIGAGLDDGGEFWSVGEYVGRTGARLWEDSYEAADAIFRGLPEQFRRNHTKRGAPVDPHLSNVDCSLNTFEGVRSEDILPVLEARLTSLQIDRWSTIVWRVLGPAYSQNYDIGRIVDRALVEHIAHRDVELQQEGLRPVAMKGIFVRR
jgi:SAM-dependent methyltransferase